MNFRIIHAIDQRLRFGEEVHLLADFLCTVDEILIVCLPDVGEHTDGRADDVLQRHHLIGFGDAGLKDGHVVGGVHLPHRQRHTYL